MRTPFLSPNRRVRPPSVPVVRDPSVSDNLRGTMLMVVSMATFTCNDAAMKAVTQTLPLYEAVALRGMMVVALMLVVAGMHQGGVRLAVARADRLPLVLRTLADIASTMLYLLALRHMALADLSAIMQALPLAVTLAAALVFRERLGWRRLSAIGIGFAGVMLILRPGTGVFDIWSALGLGAMFLIVLRDIATRKFSTGTDSSTIAFYAALSVMVSGFVLGLAETWRLPSLHETALLFLAAALLTVGYISAVATMRVGEISFVSTFLYTSLLFDNVMLVSVFNEWPDLWTWAGSGLVVGAGLYTILRERTLRRAG